MAGRTSTSPAIPRPIFSSTIIATARFTDIALKRRRRLQRRRPHPSRHGRGRRRLRRRRLARHHQNKFLRRQLHSLPQQSRRHLHRRHSPGRPRRQCQFLGWGALFVDVDNDGWPDIVIVNGHVYPEIEGKGLLSSFRERKLIYWNEHNGKFKDVSLDAGPGITKPFNSHGLAAADFRNDGSVELLVNNSYDAPSLLKNDAPQGNWLTVKLIGTKSNRDAIGARVNSARRRPPANARSPQRRQLHFPK